MSLEEIKLKDDLKALNRLEKILKEKTKLNNILVENAKLREQNRNLITENRVMLEILKTIDLEDEQQKTIFNIMFRKVYKYGK